MSAKILLDNITIKNNSSLFTDPICFQVTFSTLQELKNSINWKVLYVGSAISEQYDQVLQQFQIDPIPNPCTSKFEISCNPPMASKIPKNELICVTALILTASYGKQQFIRVGYYVHNQLTQQIEYSEYLKMDLSKIVSKIKRTIISDKPRITKFNIQWDIPQIKISNYHMGSLDYYFGKLSKFNEQDSDSQKNNCKLSDKQTVNGSDNSQSLMKSQ